MPPITARSIRKTPHAVRAILLAALAYFILPFDIIPDFIAGLGYTDDATILLAAIGMVRAHITPVHREAARRALAEEEASRSTRSSRTRKWVIRGPVGKAEPQTRASPPLAGGPTNRWREAAAIFGEG